MFILYERKRSHLPDCIIVPSPCIIGIVAPNFVHERPILLTLFFFLDEYAHRRDACILVSVVPSSIFWCMSLLAVTYNEQRAIIISILSRKACPSHLSFTLTRNCEKNLGERAILQMAATVLCHGARN
jgi:hypothetical protein